MLLPYYTLRVTHKYLVSVTSSSTLCFYVVYFIIYFYSKIFHFLHKFKYYLRVQYDPFDLSC